MRSTTSGTLLACLLAAACAGGEGPTQPPINDPPAPPALAQVVLLPSAPTTVVGSTYPVTATAFDVNDHTATTAFTWQSLNPAVATVSNGTITGVAVGTAEIVASAEEFADTIRVTVNTPLGPSPFTIQFRYLATTTADERAIYEQAAARWTRVIRSALGAYPVHLGAGTCTPEMPAMNESVTGLVVWVEKVDPTPGAPAGSGTVCFPRAPVDGGFPVVSTIYLNSQVVTNSLAGGSGSHKALETLMAHELGHALGIGALWQFGDFSALLVGYPSPGTDPIFAGIHAREQFASVSGGRYNGTPVPVEDMVAYGAGGHWRSSVLRDELMIGDGSGTRLSVVSAGSLEDLGYAVDYTAADPYAMPAIPISLRIGTIGAVASGQGRPDFVALLARP